MSRRKTEQGRWNRASHSLYDEKDGSKIQLSDSFQEIMYVQFLNLNVSYSMSA